MHKEEPLLTELRYLDERTALAPHHHRGYEIIYVVKGEIILEVGGSSLSAKGPCLLFIDVLDDHQVRVLSPVYQRYYLTAALSLGDALGDRQKLLSLFRKGGAVYGAPPGTRALFEALGQEYGQARLYGRELIACKLTELFLLVFRQQRLLEQTVREASPLVLQIRRCIEAECASPLTVKGLAERFFISEYHFIRIFKEQTGYTPKQFLQENRLSLAKEFLARTEWDLERIAGETGFAGAGAFIRAFKKGTGTTPDKYRRGVL